MKKRFIIISLPAVFAVTTGFVLNSGGIAGKTGSPGEATCANCHGGGAGITTVSINATPQFTNNQFLPGQTYTISIDVTNASFSKFGFGCEILNSSNANAGTIQNAGTGVGFAFAGAKKNAIHTSPKSGTGTANFTFEWTAPTSGTATIYAAGNAVNGNSSDTGDKPGNTNQVLTAFGTAIPDNSINHVNFQLFPNPSAEAFTVQYELSLTSMVNITITDLNGKEIKTIVNENQENGIHEIKGSLPTEIANGIYLLKFSVNGNIAAQRMLVKR